MALKGSQVLMSRIVTGYFQGTGCIRAEEPVEYSPRKGVFVATIAQCRPNDIHCRIHQFFAERRADFDKIRRAVEVAGKPSPQLNSTKETIDDASQDARRLCDDRVCKRIGDAIAAVDGRDMEHFAANNDSEWKLLADVMGKKLINPTS